MTDYMVTGLMRRRSEIAGHIKRGQAEIARMVKDLEHLDGVLRLVAPELEIQAIAPKMHKPPEDWSKRGEMSRTIFAILRLSQIPMTSRQIAAQMIVERGLEGTPQMLVNVGKRVGACLADRRKQGLVDVVGNPDSMWLRYKLAGGKAFPKAVEEYQIAERDDRAD